MGVSRPLVALGGVGQGEPEASSQMGGMDILSVG
jgi:hypothetical protein